jgi:phosphoribosylanthranilate isomerase
MLIKICGITRLTDALFAVREGATAIGMVFWPKSPRRVDPTIAAEIVATLPADVLTVGVFVNATVEEIREVVTSTGIRVVQLHGDEPTSYIDAIDQPIFRSATLDNVVDVAHDWPADTRAANVARERRLVLAGGLTPDNIEEAIMTVRPYGVDVSSGVEASPGVKDFDKVSQFLKNARAAYAQDRGARRAPRAGVER